MRRIFLVLYLAVVGVLPAHAVQISLATLNCYWFLGEEESRAADKPRTTEEYSLKAGHRHVGGEERRLYTDHFPLVAKFNVGTP
jgi:hypothetical protein